MKREQAEEINSVFKVRGQALIPRFYKVIENLLFQILFFALAIPFVFSWYVVIFIINLITELNLLIGK